MHCYRCKNSASAFPPQLPLLHICDPAGVWITAMCVENFTDAFCCSVNIFPIFVAMKGFSNTYFGARYYSDNMMQWLSVDPMSDERPSLTFPVTQHWQHLPAIFPWYRCHKQRRQPCSWQRSSRTLLPSNSSFQ